MKLKSQFLSEFAAAIDEQNIEILKIKYLGKKGLMAEEMQSLSHLEGEAKREKAIMLNQTKDLILSRIKEKQDSLQKEKLLKQLATEKLDSSLPQRRRDIGSIHPISYNINHALKIFTKLGFTAVSGPEIEDDYHNFTGLNIAKNHPARQMHDTFYLEKNLLLRTHTSSVQIRTMKNSSPPFAFVTAGKTYRADSDATHTPMFHQLEAVLVSEKANLPQLKFTIEYFLSEFFESKAELRFRSSFFPFTEPSLEVDIACKLSENQIDLSNRGDFLEVLGCGMIHPKILTECNIDTKKYSGFAIGMGIERMTMLKYGMRDLRKFFNSETSWREFYNFPPYLA